MSIARKTRRWFVAGTIAVSLATVSGLGTVSAREKDEEARVNVTISRSVQADSSGFMSYTVKATNSGDGYAKDTTITLPFNPLAQRLVDVKFNDSDAWVSALRDNAVVMKTGRLASDGGAVEATVRFAPVGQGSAQLSEPLSFVWDDEVDGGAGRSNDPDSATATQASVQVGGTGLQQTASGFKAGEAVVFWFNTPGGNAVPAVIEDGQIIVASAARDDDDKDKDDDDDDNKPGEYMGADGRGSVSMTINTRGLSAGSYSIVARGIDSGVTSVGTFDVR
jgi:hypothetical protein